MKTIFKSICIILLVVGIVFFVYIKREVSDTSAGVGTDTGTGIVYRNNMVGLNKAVEYQSYTATIASTKNAKLSIKGVDFNISLADTPALRQKGLSGRQGLSENEAMLFVFDTDDFHAFWMKDMNFPIDIIWIDSDNRVVDFVERVSPDSYPQSFKPKSRARKVIEVQAGRVHNLGVKVGDQVVGL